MLGITSLTGCARSEKFNEISSIYSFGNTYLSDEKKEKYSFSRENIRVFDCELLGTIIVIEGNDYDYIVPETKAWNHMCYMNKNYITIILSNPVNYSTDSVQMIKGNYLPLEEFLDEEEKEKDSFYIEELVEIQNRINKTEKTLTRKIS